MTRIKICGITNVDDALAAVAAGADAIGLVLAPSPRRVDYDTAGAIVAALPPFVTTVAVLVDPTADQLAELVAHVGVDALQLHGDEPPELCHAAPRRVIKRFNIIENDTADRLAERMRPYRVAGYLLDPGAGSGRVFDWRLARGLPGPLIVSGGLRPENVAQAIRAARPYGVDVCSGVEAAPGRKDHDRLRQFVQAVRSADAQLA